MGDGRSRFRYTGRMKSIYPTLVPSLALLATALLGSAAASDTPPMKAAMLLNVPTIGRLEQGTVLPPTHPFMVRADKTYDLIYLITSKLVPNPTERDTWVKIAWTWAGYESGWHPSPKGPNDDGAACGVLQVHVGEVVAALEPDMPGITCKKVRADLALGVEAGLRIMLYFEQKCGSKAAAMTAFSTNGLCPVYENPVTKVKGGWVLPIVKKRCKLAGLTDECRPTGA
jgi:hypothetical protein